MDITTKYLEAAFIDQRVAGTFGDSPYAYVAVLAEHGWKLGIAVANEDGYSPIVGTTFDTQAEAKEWSDGLNEHIGLTPDQVMRITISTMGGRPYQA
jgi:hypothetical protein